MQQVRLSARARADVGKGAARASRRAGNIPAILYGHGREPLPIQLDSHTFRRLVATEAIENALISLDIDGEQDTVMVKEIQRDPVSREILHTDLLRISLTETVTTRVPVNLEGVPLGVREEGGILEFAHRDLSLRCLPMEIPQQIEISVAGLAVGDSIQVGDIQLPETFVSVDDSSVMILSVRPPLLREVQTVEAEEEIEGGEPEVITRRREEESGEEDTD